MNMHRFTQWIVNMIAFLISDVPVVLQSCVLGWTWLERRSHNFRPNERWIVETTLDVDIYQPIIQSWRMKVSLSSHYRGLNREIFDLRASTMLWLWLISSPHRHSLTLACSLISFWPLHLSCIRDYQLEDYETCSLFLVIISVEVDRAA